MLCKHCKEQIDVGEAHKEEPNPHAHGKKWFFHTGCHLDWRVQRNNHAVSEHFAELKASRTVH